ncbi:MAG: 4-hydroxy-3-methylbut-2-enyl diphosphate reductase [Planctomycetes bacterium]|nr:4-hydroxy-3-methylbut-2-enyl diphosphate reductase [Planctomycetota bacterium]
MKILLSNEIGYCYGVEDAVEIAIQIARNNNGKKIYTYGYIIHNPETINLLQKQYGVATIENADDITETNSIVIIRTHGAKKGEIEKIRQRGIQVVDATCPFVIKTHRIVTALQKEGFFVVVFGKSYHPEVIGILGQVDLENISCVQTKEDAEKIDWKLKIACVFQSTVTFEDFSWAIVPLARKCYEFKIIKTICEVTVTRQKYSADIAKEVDTMLVLGGMNSSNTKKLVEMCKNFTKTHHLETIDELKQLNLSSLNKIGITTGTSTPMSVVEEAIEHLKIKYGAILEEETIAI